MNFLNLLTLSTCIDPTIISLREAVKQVLIILLSSQNYVTKHLGVLNANK